MTTQSNDVVADLQRRISECDHERCEDCELMAPAIALIKSLEYALQALYDDRIDYIQFHKITGAEDEMVLVTARAALALARGESTGDEA